MIKTMSSSNPKAMGIRIPTVGLETGPTKHIQAEIGCPLIPQRQRSLTRFNKKVIFGSDAQLETAGPPGKGKTNPQQVDSQP